MLDKTSKQLALCRVPQSGNWTSKRDVWGGWYFRVTKKWGTKIHFRERNSDPPYDWKTNRNKKDESRGRESLTWNCFIKSIQQSLESGTRKVEKWVSNVSLNQAKWEPDIPKEWYSFASLVDWT